MHRKTSVFILALVLVFTASAIAEDWPPEGQHRFTVYWTGSCNGTKTYSGHFEFDCNEVPHNFGTRSGKWRHIIDTSCDTLEVVNEVFEVCSSGSTCSATSGTWTTITEQQFSDSYCP